MISNVIDEWRPVALVYNPTNDMVYSANYDGDWVTLIEGETSIRFGEVEAGDRTPGSCYAADILPPRWFYKVPSKDSAANVADLVSGARAAAAVALVTGSHTTCVPIEPEPLEVDVQIRSRHRAAPAIVRSLGAGRARVEFAQPQRAVAPGQSAVFYAEDLVLGGGIVENVRKG